MKYIISILIFGIASLASAQTAGSIAIGSNPEYPEAFEIVTLTISDLSLPLDGSTVTWKQDGIVIREGIGITSTTITTKDLGIPITVSVEVVTPTGDTLTGQKVITPSDVDLIWESDSYTPPFYKGKALNPPEGSILVTAIPHVKNSDGASLSLSDLVFTWRYNGRAYADRSGIGQNTFFVTTTPLENTVSVEVADKTGTILATESVSISPSNPLILFYENHPLLGILDNKAIEENYEGTITEVTFNVYPYYFSVDSSDDSLLDYRWRLGNTSLTDQKNSITLRRGNTPSSAALTVSLEHINTPFQRALKKISVLLKAQ